MQYYFGVAEEQGITDEEVGAVQSVVMAVTAGRIRAQFREADAVCEVSFDVRRGERVALLGKSGSGKSTLLNLIAGLDRPTAGRICVSGRELSELSAAEIADYRRDCVGMIFQAYNLVPWRTALQNVELPMVFARRGKGERETAAREALAAVGLAERIRHRPSELSGGEQQRVAIASMKPCNLRCAWFRNNYVCMRSTLR